MRGYAWSKLRFARGVLWKQKASMTKRINSNSLKRPGKMALAGALGLCVLPQATAQNWPAKSIRCIIPTAPGGGSDAIVRLIGQRFTQTWGQQVVVDHRPGAGMTIGIDLVAKAAPDGYTLAVVNSMRPRAR